MKRLILTIFLCLALTIPAYALTANQNAIELLERAILLLREPVPLPPPDPPPVIGPKRHTVWVDKFSGKEKTTRFKSDGDNPQFERFGAVVFGYWAGRRDAYVYNTKYHNQGRGHVEYHPGIAGRYEATWYYRMTGNRSKKPPDVRHIRNGVRIAEFLAPAQYSESSAYRSTKFTFDLQAGDYIEIMPADHKSIAFGRMEFKRMD